MIRGRINNARCLPIETLRAMIAYDADTGSLTWLERPVDMFNASKTRSAHHIQALWNSRYAGKEALSADCNGYRHGHIAGHIYRAHRVAFALHHGRWPDCVIDHANGDRSDNRICNLREASRVENSLNRGLNANNTSGCRGVSWVKRKTTWAVRVSVPGKGRKTIGYFKSYEKAVGEYMRNASEHHGEFFVDARLASCR